MENIPISKKGMKKAQWVRKMHSNDKATQSSTYLIEASNWRAIQTQDTGCEVHSICVIVTVFANIAQIKIRVDLKKGLR